MAEEVVSNVRCKMSANIPKKTPTIIIALL